MNIKFVRDPELDVYDTPVNITADGVVIGTWYPGDRYTNGNGCACAINDDEDIQRILDDWLAEYVRERDAKEAADSARLEISHRRHAINETNKARAALGLSPKDNL